MTSAVLLHFPRTRVLPRSGCAQFTSQIPVYLSIAAR